MMSKNFSTIIKDEQNEPMKTSMNFLPNIKILCLSLKYSNRRILHIERFIENRLHLY